MSLTSALPLLFPFWFYKTLKRYVGPLIFKAVPPGQVPTISNGKVGPASDIYIYLIILATHFTGDEAEQRETLTDLSHSK